MKELLSRRGLLLSLGAKIADLTPEEEVELAKPAELVTKTGLKIDVIDVDFKHKTEMIDVTSMGDSSPQYVRGISSAEFVIRGYPHQGFSIEELLGNEIPFEHSFGTTRVSVNLFVTEVRFVSKIGAITEVVLQAVASGGVREEKIEQPEPDLQTNVRRGIKL